MHTYFSVELLRQGLSTVQLGHVVSGSELPDMSVHRQSFWLVQRHKAYTICHLSTRCFLLTLYYFEYLSLQLSVRMGL